MSNVPLEPVFETPEMLVATNVPPLKEVLMELVPDFEISRACVAVLGPAPVIVAKLVPALSP
jgi:hypothetical protein